MKLQVQSFDCGDWPGAASLNDFLNTEEVEQYADMGLGQTTLVYYKGALVGYFTTNPDRFSVDYVRQEFHALSEPSRRWQKKGLGETMIMHIGTEAIEKLGDGVRLLILEAYPQSIPSYQRVGFQLTNGELRAKGRAARRRGPCSST